MMEKKDSPTSFAFIVGAMKCGSTGLYNSLIQHPSLCACTVKEPDFFSDPYNDLTDLQHYLSLWPQFNSGKHRYAIEASVSYTYGVPVAKRVISRLQQTGFEKKFIYIVRDPVERIESHYTHAFVNRFPSAERPLKEQVPTFFIDISRYATLIDLFSKTFGRENVLVLEFSRFKNQRLGVLEQVTDFLGIENIKHSGSLKPHHNPSAGKVRLNSLGRKLLRFKVLAQKLPHPLVRYGRHLFGIPVNGRFRLTEEQKKEVMQELRYEMDYLGAVYDIDTESWISRYQKIH